LALAALSILALVVALAWLRWDAHRPLDDHFSARHGALTGVSIDDTTQRGTQRSDYLTVHSDSGLAVSLRVLRDDTEVGPIPVLMILGGHRTGRDAVDLFGDVSGFAVVALDYPYAGPERVRGLAQTFSALPPARRAFVDTPPAVALALDWLERQTWAHGGTVLIGASLGVPFAAKAAARDPRIDGVILVHGAADNEIWLTAQVARRVETPAAHGPLGTLLYWLAYGPTFDTAANVAQIAPRPVLIIGARDDERTPAGQTEALFAAAGEPKRLRWTDGRHVEPDRTDVIDQMMAIASQELEFLLPR
jgi:dienelactone hydrolase